MGSLLLLLFLRVLEPGGDGSCCPTFSSFANRRRANVDVVPGWNVVWDDHLGGMLLLLLLLLLLLEKILVDRLRWFVFLYRYRDVFRFHVSV